MTLLTLLRRLREFPESETLVLCGLVFEKQVLPHALRLYKILCKCGGRVLLCVKTPTFCVILLAVLGCVAMLDFLLTGLSRRTITFYAMEGVAPLVEERFVPSCDSQEDDVRAYIEEVLLGSSEADIAPLFTNGTRLQACFLRKGVVTVDFSEEAALPVMSAFSVLDGLDSLKRDILRNFYYVNDVRFFIAGEDAQFDS